MHPAKAECDRVKHLCEEPALQTLIVGFGSIGKRHAQNVRSLIPNAELTILRHRRPPGSDPASAVADRVVYDIQDALSYSPRLAIIASPAPMHIETATQLANHGVHLLVEKPLSDQLEGIDELLGICQARKTVLLVGYTLRFSQPLQTVKRAIAEGQIGRLLGIHAEVGQYLPDWRPQADYRQSVTAQQSLGGGALLELSHEIDYVRWIAGNVRSLHATAQTLSDLEIDVEDWAELDLQFESGVSGHVHVDMVQRFPVRCGKAIGTHGTLEWDLMSQQVHINSIDSESKIELGNHSGTDRNLIYEELVRHFLDCIEGNAQPVCTGADGRAVLEIVLAAKKSAQTGERIDL